MNHISFQTDPLEIYLQLCENSYRLSLAELMSDLLSGLRVSRGARAYLGEMEDTEAPGEPANDGLKERQARITYDSVPSFSANY